MSSAGPARTLVIVESPGKIKKLQEYLGPDYEVKASIGHVRDLPAKRDQIPAAIAGEPWASLGVNPETFRPYYIISPDKHDVVKGLQAAHNRCDRTLLAMDQDREGESIAWHIAQELRIRDPQRISFSEITRNAIQQAIGHPRPLNLNLVAAQESRRIIDRLVGFKASNLLRDAIAPSLSAGRVQSATLMILVQRELSRMSFVAAGYHVLRADSDTTPIFVATVTHIRVRTAPQPQALAKPSNFTVTGELQNAENVINLTTEQARAVAKAIDGVAATVTAVTRSEVRSRPAPPFVTSTLQQAGERLGLSIDLVMSTAQKLYEAGYITYMRTDSVALSEEALTAARSEIMRLFGPSALPDAPRRYATHDKGAQEAHEAIRPSGSVFRSPDSTDLQGVELRLYEAIYVRTLASQMHDTVHDKTVLTLTSGPATLSASGRVLKSEGHTRLTGAAKSDKPDEDDQDAPQGLPNLQEGDTTVLRARGPELKSTSVPPRYSPGDLIEAMKRAGIGRPSTYKDTLSTLAKREYTVQQGKFLSVSATGLLVGTYLHRQLTKLVAKEFTSRMESQLDQVAGGKLSRVDYLKEAWTDELGPAIEHAERTEPFLNLPHLPGMRVLAKRGLVMLNDGQTEAEIPPFLVPGDLTRANAAQIMTGTFAFPKRQVQESAKAYAKSGDKPEGARTKTSGGKSRSASANKPKAVKGRSVKKKRGD